MTKAKSKLKCPEGWTLILTDNKYAALHKESQFQTAYCGEKEDAIKLAIFYAQYERVHGKLPATKLEIIDDSVVSENEEHTPSSQIGNDARDVQEIPISRIQPSPDNPRKHFDETELAELAASIREKGVEIPIAVLPAKAFGMHTLIYGERRWRASNAAGKTSIPALILDISEERANELRLNENLQRKNLTPLEEAAAFQLRMEKYSKSLQDIAAQTGYSIKTVTKRLRLNLLPDVTKEAMDTGKLCLGSALAIARLDNLKQMAEATDVFLRQNWYGYATDPTKAASYIEQAYFTRLNKAPFNVKDVTLLPEAGSCLDCPKRTGNQSELFDDVKETDTCLDRKCYDQKCAAHIQRELDAAEAKGLKVLSEKEIKQIAPHGFINSDYVDLADQPYQDKKNRSWKQLMGKEAPAPVIAVVKGQIKRLVPKADAAEIVKAQHNITIELPTKSSANSSAQDKHAHKMRQQVTKETLVALGAWALAHFREKFTNDSLSFWQVLGAIAISNLRSAAQDYLAKFYELEPKKNKFGGKDYEAALLAHLQAFPSSAHVAAFVVQSLAVDRWHWWTQPGGSEKPYDDHKEMCKVIGFDLNAAMKEAKKAVASKSKGAAK